MSIDGLVWAMEQELPTANKFVLVILGDMANPETRECWPSQSTIAKKCALTRQSVNRIVAELQESGHIDFVTRQRKNGSDTSCCYRINMPAMPKVMGEVRGDILGMVYVVAGEAKAKIGVTRDMKTRIQTLQSGGGQTLTVIKTWPMPMRRARRIERLTLERLAEFRLVGEWVSVSSTDAVAAVEAVLVSYEATPPSLPSGHPPVVEQDTQNPKIKPLTPKGVDNPANAGKAPKAKAEVVKRTAIGGWRPGEAERAAATAYWAQRGRPDLIAVLDEEVDHFCASHGSRGSRMASWPLAWQTWYTNALKMRRPPPGTPSQPMASPAQIDLERWVWRLETFHHGREEDACGEPEVAAGHWDRVWGPKPSEAGCQVPQEAVREFARRHPPKVAM